MVKCKNCRIYAEGYDNLQRAHNDVLEVGKPTDIHFCVLFENGIPPTINPDGGECEYYVERGNDS